MPKRIAWRMVRSLIITYFISAILLIALSFALYQFRLPESQVNLAVNAIYILSCLAGGFLSGKLMRTRRFLWGALTGFLYVAFLLLMSCIQSSGITESPVRILSIAAMCIFSGMAGGMLS